MKRKNRDELVTSESFLWKVERVGVTKLDTQFVCKENKSRSKPYWVFLMTSSAIYLFAYEYDITLLNEWKKVDVILTPVRMSIIRQLWTKCRPVFSGSALKNFIRCFRPKLLSPKIILKSCWLIFISSIGPLRILRNLKKNIET